MTFVFTSQTAAVISAASVYRQHLSVYMHSNHTLYLLLEATGTVSNANFSLALKHGDYWECPLEYKGRITGILDGAGMAHVCQHDGAA